MRLRTYTARELRRRSGRTLLTLLGIALGLAAVVATRLTTDAVRRAYRDLFDGAAEGTVLEVTAPALAGFDADLAASLESVPGVRTVVPQVRGVAAVAGHSGNVAVPVLGADTGRTDGALMDGSLADALGLTAGQTFFVWAPAGRTPLRLAGILPARADAAATGGRMIVPLACAQRLFGLAGRVNSLRVRLTDRADGEQVREEVSRRLPAGLVVQPPGARAALGRDTLLAAERGLDALGLVALIAAAFIVLNTFLLNLGERRRQLAILRALGATRRQVTGLLLRELLMLGLAGSAAGCGAGLGLALVLLGAVGQFLGISLPRPSLTPGGFLGALLLGPAAALVATLLPAWHAGRRPPLAELLPRPARSIGPRPRRPGGVRAPLMGVVGTLAGQQLARHPSRTLLTAAVLTLALAVTVCFGQTLRGILTDLRHWYRETIVADFLVYGSVPDTGFLLTTALPETLAAEIARLDGVAAVDRLAFLPARGGDRPVLVLARTFPPEQPLPLDLREGDAGAVRHGLMQGEIVLGAGLARQLGLRRGDAFVLSTPHGPRELRVAGTAVEYAAGGSAVYLEWETARRLLDVPGAHVFLVSGGGAAAQALHAFCDLRCLVMESNAELRATIDRSVRRITGALSALMALVFAIASLGIVNTLLMNVRDQQRHLGVLRALGLTCGQVRRAVLTQGLLLGGVSLGPGTAGGLALAYLIHRVGMAGAGSPGVFRVDGVVLAGCCASAVIVALLASLPAARRAVRLPVARVLNDS
jgi:putative ABC transport system permease protein